MYEFDQIKKNVWINDYTAFLERAADISFHMVMKKTTDQWMTCFNTNMEL